MTRTGRDSTTAADIPTHGLDVVMGYGNGAYAWKAADWARFTCPHVRIDVNGSDPGGCGVLDVETGDATVAGAVTWVKARHQLHPGNYAVIYCNRSTLTPLFNAMAAAGLKVGSGFHLWIATLDGVTKTVPDMTGVVAVQWAGQAHTGGHYDESIVYDAAWHAPTPAPAPAPPPAQQHEYVVVDLTAGGATFKAVSGMVLK